jgi:signal peptidase I
MKTATRHTLRDVENKPAIFNKKEGELKLSGPALVEILQAVLDKGMPFRFRAKGFSMTPFIKDGDVITVSPLSSALLRLGDVVAFTHPGTGRLAIHRVVGKKHGYYIVRGDNTSSLKNDLIPETNILGSMSKVERKGKEVFLGLGPERLLIALLTRIGLLSHLLTPLWKTVRPFVKRMAL